MPEIKHQFTGGKMNKDLDERLIPNGEYRDALNIQVSTSDSSDVGTVQNILGNSLLVGQDFISEQAFCVGSIADEKNDKLYYFVYDKNELIVNGDFSDGLSSPVNFYSYISSTIYDAYTIPLTTTGNWTFLAEGNTGYNLGANIDFANEHGISITGGVGGVMKRNFILGETAQSACRADQYINVEAGKTYIVSYKRKYISGSGKNNIYFMPDPGGSTFINLATTQETSGNWVTITDSWTSPYTGTIRMPIYFSWATGGSGMGTLSAEIDDFSVAEDEKSYIIEYDSKDNLIKPVFVDSNNETLQLSPNRPITGINIIDDLLFWTDNYSEPKNINIQRSINGTDKSGTIHTKIINEFQDIKLADNINVEEEHITVIKKAPKSPLGLNFTDPADREGKIYSGLMNTTLDPGSGTNTSSFILNTTKDEIPFDFSNIDKNDVIQIEIPTDIDSASNFTLDWKVGDTIVFKEFSTGGAPTVPLDTWIAKGIIEDWTSNNFHDQSANLLQNGYFNLGSDNWGNTANNIGSFFGLTTQFGWWWRGVSQTMHFQSTTYFGNWHKLWQSPISHNFKLGDQYKLTYTLSHTPAVTIGNLTLFPQADLDGQVMGRIVVNGDNYDFDWKSTVGTHVQTITLDATSQGGTSLSNFNNKLVFQTDGNQNCNGELDSVQLEWIDAPNAQAQIKIIDIDDNPPTPSNTSINPLQYVVDKYTELGHLFEDKFVRFSYRYRYQDREYSTFAPFSQVAFSPGNFNYHPKQGYNLGMTNQLIELELKGFVPSDLPKNVEAIDILVKIEDSPNIYIVDTIKANDDTPFGASNNAWDLDSYLITSETIKGIIPSNQLLRPWDNVPKRALAQEVTGNRLIYGNYTQGYNLLNSLGNNYRAEFDVTVDSVVNDLHNKKSIKSLRDYQLGVVFSDEYGRETPVLSNQSGSFYVDKARADKNNILKVGFLEQDYPVDMKYFKFFIKETSSEYYNMAMDRYYLDDDSNTWLSFPSSDRNKIDLDTVLILKKGSESNELVEERANYKVLAIENEAPDFIQTSKILIEEKTHISTSVDLFGSALEDAPLEGVDNFKMNYEPFASSSGESLHEIDDGKLYIEFGLQGASKTSKRYRINKISSNIDIDGIDIASAEYNIKLKTILGDDVNFITDDISGNNPTKILDNVSISIYKYVLDKNDSFEGRFFVKIFGDNVFNERIVATTLLPETKYRVIDSKKLYFMASDHVTRGDDATNANYQLAGHGSDVTGLVRGAYNTNRTEYAFAGQTGDVVDPTIPMPDWNGTGMPFNWNNFSRYAVFFRNYKHAPNVHGAPLVAGGTENIGQYKWGEHDTSVWKTEFEKYTSEGDNIWTNGWDATGDTGATPPVYPTPEIYIDADHRQKDDEVWFIDKGPYVQRQHATSALHWAGQKVVEENPHGERTGITTHGAYWNLEIGVGGIHTFPDNVQDNYVGNFFNIGQTNSPVSYTDEDTVGLVSKFKPGIQFRFKEDPSETVYTCDPATINRNVIRYAGTHESDAYNLIDYEIPRLSPNFTRNWILKVKPELTWNPATDALGAIENGYHITVPSRSGTANTDHMGVTTGNTPSQYQLLLNTLDGVDPIYGNIPIYPGLILTHYNDVDGDGGTELPGQPLIIKKIYYGSGIISVFLTGYERIITEADIAFTPANNKGLIFRQPTMNGYSQNSVNRINQNASGFGIFNPALKAVGYNIEFVEAIPQEPSMPDNPAIFETEPKEQADLDIYYEASGLNAVKLDENNISTVLPIGSIVTSDLEANALYYTISGQNSYIPDDTRIIEYVDGNTIKVDKLIPVAVNQTNLFPVIFGPGIAFDKPLKVTRPNGSIIRVSVKSIVNNGNDETNEISINTNLWKEGIYLDWHNCYSFGNGVESNRIKDSFNLPFTGNGVKVSTTLEYEFQEEHRKYGLIYSGIYNSNSGLNDLNQFIAAEKITKDVNPIYGSIQKLHSRDSDLVALCEDKCLRILVSKDALYNADGSPQLLAREGILGQTIPFSGEFGISKNPESFASESYRVYFSDKVRGAIMRLSKDGLTPISMHGMRDWFKDNLKLSTKLVGSYDDRKEEYNITLADRKTLGEEIVLDTKLIDNTHWLIHLPGSLDEDYSGEGVLITTNSSSAQYSTFYQPIELVDGKQYELKIEFSDRNEGGDPSIGAIDGSVDWGIRFFVYSAVYRPFGSPLVSNGTHIREFTFDQVQNDGSNILLLAVQMTNGHAYDKSIRIKNVSVKEIIVDPITVSFKEDVKGWVSFKSFVPENGISLTNDYHTMLSGKLYKHHLENSSRNNFYDSAYNSSINVILNDAPGIIKSYRTLGYEGSQSKIIPPPLFSLGTELITEFTNGTTYPFDQFISSGNNIANATKSPAGFAGAVSNAISVGLGDIIRVTFDYVKNSGDDLRVVFSNQDNGAGTQISNTEIISDSGAISLDFTITSTTVGYLQFGTSSAADTINFSATSISTKVKNILPAGHADSYYNLVEKDGWSVSTIKTDKQEGSLDEFIEKEGKWFNYIKGIDSDISAESDFGAFDIQGVGTLKQISGTTNTVIVTSIDHTNAPLGSIDSGKYALFNEVDMTTMLGYIPEVNPLNSEQWNNLVITVIHERGGVILGNVDIRLRDDIMFFGDTAHFRKENNWSSGDWQVGDVIRLPLNSLTLSFDNTVNASLQVNDTIYFQTPSTNGLFDTINPNNITKYGNVITLTDKTITVNLIDSIPAVDDYIMFAKNHTVNTSSLLGYFADVKFVNNSTDKIELFSVSSEITESSK